MTMQAIETLPEEPLVGSNGAPSVRANRYGEQFVQQYTLERLALEGSLFRVRNATIATGIAQTANTTQDTAKPFICGRNPTISKRSVYLHRLYLRPTAVSSSQTTQRIDVITDTGGLRASAGTDYNIKVTGLNASVGYNNLKGDVSRASVLDQLYVGVPVWTPGTNQQLAAHFSPRTTTIPVIGDEFIINFGSLFAGGPVPTLTPVGTTIDTFVKNEPPVIVPPGCGFEVVLWAASIAGAMSWEFDLIWSER